MDEFFAIKLFNKPTGKRGFVLVQDDKVMVSDEFTGLCAQFATKKEAQVFIKEKKLQKNGIDLLIIPNTELMQEGACRPIEKTENIYAVMDLKGDFLFFNTITKQYYFDQRDTGYCAWFDRISIDEFINSYNLGREVVIKQINK